MLDLTVKVININPEENHEILTRCPVLNEYSQFVEIVRKHQESGVENPFQNAVNECIQKGILADYLQKKGSEAVNMLKAEYDYDMDIAVQREEAKEEGIEIGKGLGRSEGVEIGKGLGRTEGMELLALLIQHLLKDNRQEEVARASVDADFRNKLLQEYGLGL